jgi:hypothetical protein
LTEVQRLPELLEQKKRNKTTGSSPNQPPPSDSSVWDYDASPQRYRDGPSPAEAERLRQEFETIFATQTGYGALDAQIAKTRTKQAELLTVLSHPEVPLHNNPAELGSRVSARRRDVSLHRKTPRGARARDFFTTLVQTCKKLGVSAYAYLRDRLLQAREIPRLAILIRTAAAEA